MAGWWLESIKSKVLLGLGSMLMLTTLIAITGVWWIMELERVNDKIVGTELDTERQIKDWHRSMRANTLRTVLLFNTADPALEKQVNNEIDDTVGRVNAILLLLEPKLRTGPLAGPFAVAVELRIAYQKIRVEALEAKASGNKQELRRLLAQDLPASQNNFLAAVQRLSDAQVGLMHDLVGKAKAQSQKARFAIIVSAIITFVLALSLGFAVRKLRALNQRLAGTTEFQQAILNSANFSIISTDVNGVIRSFSVGAERMLGYSSDEMVDRKTPTILHDMNDVMVHAQQLSLELGRHVEPGFQTLVAKASDGMVDEHEWVYLRKDGTRLPVMLSVSALRDAQLRLCGFLGIAYDLTERKKVERMKNEFISTVSHELRTPLTSIRGSLGLLVTGTVGEIPARARALLDIANNNCERLVRLINDILDIEKIESDNMHFDTITQSMHPLIEQAIDTMQSYAAQYQVKFELHSDASDVYVTVDTDRITQVVINLLSNAAKFSPAGAIVDVRLTRRAGWVRLSVTNQGQAIADAFRGRIFEKFAQADSSDTRKKGGTGLGLSISKAIIEKHHGIIDFRSEQGFGTEFYFDLPLAAESTESTESTESAGTANDHGRVLICEDDPDIAKLLALMLAQIGLTSDIAHDADQARHLLAAGAYDAMTLDLVLPGEDGISLLHWMRTQENTHNLPIVIVSAQTEEGHKITGAAVDVVDWITKPINETRLLAALQDATRKCKDAVPCVLYIEDDIDLVEIVTALLEPSFRLVHAGTLASARSHLIKQRFNLIMLDIQLPDGNGSDLLTALPAMNARTPVMIFSGQDANYAGSRNVRAVLIKSRTSNEQLLATLSQLL